MQVHSSIRFSSMSHVANQRTTDVKSITYSFDGKRLPRGWPSRRTNQSISFVDLPMAVDFLTNKSTIFCLPCLLCALSEPRLYTVVIPSLRYISFAIGAFDLNTSFKAMRQRVYNSIYANCGRNDLQSRRSGRPRISTMPLHGPDKPFPSLTAGSNTIAHHQFTKEKSQRQTTGNIS